MRFPIGEQVKPSAIYCRYDSTIVIGYKYGPVARYVIEFSSGLQLFVFKDKLEKV